MPKIYKTKKWGYYVLHNIPFYLIDITPVRPKTAKIIRSLYELQKSAAKWEICDYGVIKSPEVKT